MLAGLSAAHRTANLLGWEGSESPLAAWKEDERSDIVGRRAWRLAAIDRRASMSTNWCGRREIPEKAPGVGSGTSLGDEITTTEGHVAANDNVDACSTLSVFLNQVNAQTQSTITAARAASFTTEAQTIENALG
jgi:hypothetical protein